MIDNLNYAELMDLVSKVESRLRTLNLEALGILDWTSKVGQSYIWMNSDTGNIACINLMTNGLMQVEFSNTKINISSQPSIFSLNNLTEIHQSILKWIENK